MLRQRRRRADAKRVTGGAVGIAKFPSLKAKTAGTQWTSGSHRHFNNGSRLHRTFTVDLRSGNLKSVTVNGGAHLALQRTPGGLPPGGPLSDSGTGRRAQPWRQWGGQESRHLGPRASEPACHFFDSNFECRAGRRGRGRGPARRGQLVTPSRPQSAKDHGSRKAAYGYYLRRKQRH